MKLFFSTMSNSTRNGSFDVRRCIPKNVSFILPPDSMLRRVLSVYWSGWAERKHNWWNFKELYGILFNILMKTSNDQTEGEEFIFICKSPIGAAFGHPRIALRDLKIRIEQQLIPISTLTLEELTSFYNPQCPCSLCRYDVDVCGNYESYV